MVHNPYNAWPMSLQPPKPEQPDMGHMELWPGRMGPFYSFG